MLAQLTQSGFTGSLACTEEGKEIQTTFDEASAFGGYNQKGSKRAGRERAKKVQKK